MLPVADSNAPSPFVQERTRAGLRHDIPKIANSILDDPPDAASFIAHVALGQPLPNAPTDCVSDGTIVRMSPLIQPVRQGHTWQLPHNAGMSVEDFVRLASLSCDSISQRDVDLIERFTKQWIQGIFPNQPIRAGQDFRCEIGQPTYSEAKRAWLKQFDAREDGRAAPTSSGSNATT